MCARGSGAGRPGGTEMARLMLAVLGGLAEEGDMVNVHAVARRFSDSEDFAERLVESIKVLPAGEEFFLPLYFKDGDPDMALMEGGVRGHRIRLTHDETVALVAAFDRIGIDKGNTLRKSVEESMAATDAGGSGGQAADTTRLGGAEALEGCVAALCAGRRVTFMYQGRLDGKPRRRTVDPTGIHQSDGMWYVDAFDIDRRGPRVFRADRMGRVEDAGEAEPHDPPTGTTNRVVGIRFSDPTLLTTLWWPGLEVIGRDGDIVEARIPYYGGDWLPRRLASCGGTATTTDPEVAQMTRDVARSLLAQLGQ